MKNILLIGDSILVGSNQTSGYGTIVRDMLKDIPKGTNAEKKDIL